MKCECTPMRKRPRTRHELGCQPSASVPENNPIQPIDAREDIPEPTGGKLTTDLASAESDLEQLAAANDALVAIDLLPGFDPSTVGLAGHRLRLTEKSSHVARRAQQLCDITGDKAVLGFRTRR